MVRRGMGLLDVPKGLISRLPLIGGSSDPQPEPDHGPKEAGAPAVEAPDESGERHDDEPDEAAPDADEPEAEASSNDKDDISDTTAPSIGPNTVIEKDTPEERLARHEQSKVDAMGLDKRREVIGGDYSASFGKQLFRWAIVVVIVVAAGFGAKLLVADLDKAPAHPADKAPWSGTHQAPAPLE